MLKDVLKIETSLMEKLTNEKRVPFGETYYAYLHSLGEIAAVSDKRKKHDDLYFAHGNYYKTYEEAEWWEVTRPYLQRRLREESKKSYTEGVAKWFPVYYTDKGKLNMIEVRSPNCILPDAIPIYGTSEVAKAVYKEVLGDNLRRYFTETKQ
jgi:hypothetical protein